MVLNVNVADGDNETKLHMKQGEFKPGHADDGGVTLSLTADLARKIFVEGDAQAGMQAFMAGEIKVEGDMSQLMAMQTAQPSEKQKALLKQIKEITE